MIMGNNEDQHYQNQHHLGTAHELLKKNALSQRCPYGEIRQPNLPPPNKRVVAQQEGYLSESRQ